jgi:hypothetical protein
MLPWPMQEDRAACSSRLGLDDPDLVRPAVMDEATLAYRRLIDRFGKRTEKLGHLHHTGTIRSSVGDDEFAPSSSAASVGRYSAPGAISDRRPKVVRTRHMWVRTLGVRSGTMRRGLLAIPLYFGAVGVGHIALAVIWSAQTTGLPRDGQAFSGTFILGAGFVVLGILAALVVLPFERSPTALARASLAGLVVAATVVAYTASRGYLMGGLTSGTPCIVIGVCTSGPICAPPGGPTYIADAQPDVFLMLLASIGAFALAHLVARLQERRAISFV